MTTSSIADRLALLNTLRAVAGKPALASWKNSSAELDQRILDMTPAQELVTPPTSKPINPDVVALVSDAVKAGVKITKVPTGATSKKPTKDLDAKAAKKVAKVSKQVEKIVAKKDGAKVKATKKPAKKAATSTPKSTNEFGAYLAAQGLDPKQARATLRRKGFSAPYTVNQALKDALTKDARKK